MFNFELIEIVDFSESLSKRENEEIDAIFSAKFEMKGDGSFEKHEVKSLALIFDENNKTMTQHKRELAIKNAIQDGYTQSEIVQ